MKFIAADLGIDARNLSKTHRIAEILWSNPRNYNPKDRYPENHEIPQGTHGFVYCLIRDHGKMKTRNTVAYVGISANNSKERFYNHPKSKELSLMYGNTTISFGKVNVKDKKERSRQDLEDIEHIIIWSIWKDLYNEKKMNSLPLSKISDPKTVRSWAIFNTGLEHTTMPDKIIYPWLVTSKSGE